MNDIKRLKEQQRDKHPGFDMYIDCMSRSLLTGVATFFLGFSSTHFIQKGIQSSIRYPPKYNILISAVIASLISYKLTRDRTKACQAAWMAAEDKYTVLKDDSF